jgi:hypothetical protein
VAGPETTGASAPQEGVPGDANADPGAGDDVAGGLGLRLALQNGVPAIVRAPPGIPVGVVQAGRVLPRLPGPDQADRGPGAVGDRDDARVNLGHAQVGPDAARGLGVVADPSEGEFTLAAGDGCRRDRARPP